MDQIDLKRFSTAAFWDSVAVILFASHTENDGNSLMHCPVGGSGCCGVWNYPPSER